jgi:hypothetical protein
LPGLLQITFPRSTSTLKNYQAHSLKIVNLQLQLTMAESSGVTEASLKTKLIELLQATYVEIEDMSGILAAPPLCAAV